MIEERTGKSGETPACPERLVVEHVTGERENEVFIDNPRFIGRGHFGVIYAATARVVGMRPRPAGDPQAGTAFGDIRRVHEFPVVLKVFYNPANAHNAIIRYDICKDAGLQVPPTYRVNSQKGVILMTDLGGADSYAISANNWSIGVDALNKKQLSRIDNWDQVLMRLFTEPLVIGKGEAIIAGSELYRAHTHAIELQPDVYFFVLPKDNDSPSVRPVAVDYDIVQHPSTFDAPTLFKHNVTALGTTCKLIVENYVQEERQKEHLMPLYKICTELLSRGYGVAQ